MSAIIRFGIDLAKNSLAIAGVDQHDQLVLKKTLRSNQLLEFFANAPPALIAIESGSAAHHWARELRALGRDSRIIHAHKVELYRTQRARGKNDIKDAVAVCEAAGRPNMRFVPVKSADQQAILVVHRARSAAVGEHGAGTTS